MHHSTPQTNTFAKCARATLAALLILLTCSNASAKQTRKLTDAERDEIARRCAKLLDENEALQAVVDAHVAAEANLKEQLATAQALIKNGDEMAAAAKVLVDLYKAQIADLGQIITELKGQIAGNREEIKKLREQVDAGRWAWLKGAAVGLGVGIVVTSLVVLATGNN